MVKKGPKNLLWLFSEEGLASLYERRQALQPTVGNRTLRNVVLVSLLLFFLVTSLVSFIWVGHSAESYLRNQTGVALLPSDSLEYRLKRVGADACKTERSCYDALDAASPIFTGRDLFAFDLATAKMQDQIMPDDVLMLSFEVPPETWQKIAPRTDARPYVFSLPQLGFQEALAYAGGEPSRRFFAEELVGIGFTAIPGSEKSLRFDLVLRLANGQPTLLTVTQSAFLAFIAEQPVYQKYVDYLATKKVGAGKQLADIARIVLAVFAIFLFLFVDSSPECLGLAIFMGLKAVGVILAQAWLPQSWLPSTLSMDARHFLLCFGDIMQLYFFVQLTRLMKPTLKPWFLIGGTVALVYTVCMHYNFKAFDIDWNREIWRWRNVLLGLACMSVALRSAWSCYTKGLKARMTAMIIATSGTVVQIVYPIAHMFPSIFNAPLFQSLYNLFEMHTPYVFALSAFVNISTLEHRVKALSRELIERRSLEHEAALGRGLDAALSRKPRLPSRVRLAAHRDEGSAVLGAMPLYHWDERTSRLTVVVLEICGVGVEAAIVASASSALAHGVWTEGGEMPLGARLAVFEQRLASFLGRALRTTEATAWIGCEFDAGSRQVVVRRVHGVFPLLVAPEAGGGWNVQVLMTHNRESHAFTIPTGGALLLLSDGYAVDAMSLDRFATFLGQRIAHVGSELDETLLKEAALAYPDFPSRGDRCMVVLGNADEARKTLTPAA